MALKIILDNENAKYITCVPLVIIILDTDNAKHIAYSLLGKKIHSGFFSRTNPILYIFVCKLICMSTFILLVSVKEVTKFIVTHNCCMAKFGDGKDKNSTLLLLMF